MRELHIPDEFRIKTELISNNYEADVCGARNIRYYFIETTHT